MLKIYANPPAHGKNARRVASPDEPMNDSSAQVQAIWQLVVARRVDAITSLYRNYRLRKQCWKPIQYKWFRLRQLQVPQRQILFAHARGTIDCVHTIIHRLEKEEKKRTVDWCVLDKCQ